MMTTFSKRLSGCFIILFVLSGFALADQGGPSTAGLAWADGQDVNFNWIEISDGTALDTSVNDTFYTVNLPFTFNFYLRPFNTIYVSNNGYLTFHDYGIENFADNDSLQLDQSPDSLIAVFWDDFNTLSGGSDQIYYKTIGNSPYRRFIVEYRNVTLASGGNPLSFQIILYESLNLIKFQYLTLGSLSPSERGGGATVGVRYTGTGSDSLIYSVNTPSLSNNLAVLFFPSDSLTAASPVLDPDTVTVGTGGQPFSITINNLSLVHDDSLQEMGKADSVRIDNPFTNSIFVTGVRVDGQDYFYLNSTSAPTEPGLATWNYSSGTQDLIVLLPPFAAKDSVTIKFVENIPQTPGNFNFTLEITSRLNPSGAFSSMVPLLAEATDVARYTFIPDSDTLFAAGDTIKYTLKAEDQYGNGVINNGSVNLNRIGSNTASFIPASPVSFGMDSILTFQVTDTVMGDFNIRAVNTVNNGITGQSGLITVNPASPDTLITVSSEGNIGVGTDRLLQVQLEDAYGNVIKDSTVTFELVSGGDGNFSGSGSLQDMTNTSGVAEVLYTASTQTSFGIDTIRVSIGSVVDSVFLPLVSGPISSFDLSIITVLPAAAGTNVQVRVVAKDAFNNAVSTTDSVLMSAIGSTSAQFSPTDTFAFGGDSAVTVTVQDTVAGTFSVQAQLYSDLNKKGTSPAIQIIPAGADHFVKLSSESSITAGGQRLLQVRLEDAFDNDIAGSEITFEMVSGGNGNFAGSDSTPVTNSSGVAEALYTASTQTLFGIDTIRVSIGGVADSIFLPLVSGSISSFDLTILTGMPAAAGDTVSVQVVAKDQFGNGVLNSSLITMNAIGSMTAQFIPSNTYNFGGDSVVTIQVRDTVVKTFSVRASLVGNPTKQGTSSEIEIIPAGADHFVKLSSESSITAGGQRLLQVRLEDAFDNDIAGSEITFEMVSGGNGNFVGSDSTPVTNSSGVAEALYTASTQTLFGIDTIRVSIGGVADSIFLPLVSGSISSFDLTILTGMPAAAGDTVSVQVVAKDQFGNGALNSSLITMNAIGSMTAQFIPSNTYNFGGDSVVTIQVRDTVVKTFSVRASLVGNPTKQGTSSEIEIIPAGADHFVKLSSESSIAAGGQRLLQVRLEDAFDNDIAGSEITFEMVSGGNGNFAGSDSTPVTNSSGVAEALYTASTQTLFGIDTIRVSIGGVADSIFLPLVSGSISYFDLAILTPMPAAAGDTVSVRVVAKDIYDNPVISNSDYQMTPIGSGTATFIPSNLYTFSNDSADTISVRDTTAGFFTVKAQLTSNPSKQGTSQLIEITPASLDYLQLRSLAGNKGVSYSNIPFNINSSQNITFYAAGYDQFDNYINDIDSAFWDSTGTLVPTGTFPTTASSYTFDPAGAGSGRIFISVPSSPGIAPDTTGLITVTGAQLSYIRIQSDSSAGGTEVDTRTLAAGQSDTLFAVGYDIDNNWLGTVSSNWSVNNTRIGDFQNGLDTINGFSQVIFTADSIGNGVIKAVAVSNPTITDQTGLFTVIGGPSDHILIRNGANNGGTVYDTPLTVSADSSIRLYAAFYDSHNNYLGDSSVTWAASGLVNVPTGPAASIVFSPTIVGSGFIYTISSIEDDSTATITIVAGELTHLRIQDGSTGSAVEIDTVTLVAGEDTTMYAGGYDNDDNFRSLVSSNWSRQGNPIGIFSNPNPDSINILTGQTVGIAVVKATEDGGTIYDLTSTIMVMQGDPDSLMKVASTDNQSGSAGQDLPRDIEVVVRDAFGNLVKDDTVRFIALAGGFVNGNDSVDVLTNALGIAGVRWTLHQDTTNDMVAATAPNYTTSPDTVVFTAFVNPGAADFLNPVSALSGSARVDTLLPISFIVEVRDSSNLPVPSSPISFAIISRPAGAVGDSLTTYSTTTDAQGQASTQLHLGSKLGSYVVRAFASTTSPSFIDFTGIANAPADADTIVIVSGNNQSGTVAQQLTDSVRFKVTDRFGNVVSSEPISFNALQGGSTNPAADLTGAGGFASTAWTLGDTSGNQQLVASLPNFPSVISDTVTATAGSGDANSLSLITMRKLPFDSVAAVPGENITFVVEVKDQFNNVKPSATVRFTPQTGYNALFESNQLVSDANGRVSNVVKTDKTKDETFFRAFIAGVDTLPLHIFHIRYVAGSLQPKQISPGDTVSFQLQLNNTSPYSVVMDSNNTIFSFDDGSNSFSTPLNGAVTLPGNGSDTLFFDADTIDSNFTNTTYTPELAIKGGGADSALAGSIILPINSLSIFNVMITQITASKAVVARGETFNVTMRVRNDGPVFVNVDTTVLRFEPVLNGSVNLISGFSQLSPNTSHDFTFAVTVPGSAALQQYSVDGSFSGTTQGSGIPVSDGSSDVTDVFTVVSGANIVVQSLTPAQVTDGDPFTFTARLANSGAFGIILDSDSTYLSFGTDTLFLSQSYSVPANNKPVSVNFGPDTVTSLVQAMRHAASIRLYGTENDAEFDSTLASPDSILVQSRPDVQVASINIVPDTISQNQDSVHAQVVLSNVGALNATAIISSPSTMSLITTQGSVGPHNTGIFPITLPAGSSSDTIDFYYNIGSYLGIDTAHVSYTFSDSNSSVLYPTTPADFDIVVVQSRATLFLARNSLDPDTATQGQLGVDLRFTVQNTGESSASIASNDLSVEFANSHDLTLNPPVTFPVILAQNDTQEFVYTMNVDSNSGTGWDRYDLQVSHTDIRSGKTYTDVDVADLDSIFILAPGSASNVEIQFVQIPKVNVNRGQTGIAAKVRLKNLGQSIVRVDSLFLLPGRSGVNSTRITALPSTIQPGAFADYNFTISVDDTTSPEPVGINARYRATDLTTGSPFSLSGSNLPDTINIFIPATFVFQKLDLNKETVSEGQTGIIASGILKNGFDSTYSPVKVESMQLLFDVGGPNINPVRLSSLPQLQGNDSVLVQFDLQISDPSTYFGDVIVNLEASGTDLTEDSLVTGTSQEGDTLTIQRKGSIIIDSVSTPVVTASIGQTGIPVTVYFRNPGQASVDITSASLLFNNVTAGFFQTLNSIAVDPFTGNDTAFFSVEVLGSATPGSYTITSKVSGVEQNTQGVVSDSSVIGDNITITTPGQLRVLSVFTNFDSVSIGSQDVTVSATVRNMGSSSVLVDSLRLTFSKGSYTSADTSFSPTPLVLGGGDSTTIDFAVDVPGSNTPGISTINARVWGRDSLSLAPLQDLGADVTDAWRLVTPAALSLVSMSFTPDSVSNGQNVSFSAQVQNNGQATVRYGDTDTYLNFNGTQIPVNQNGSIYGNSTATLNFDPTTINFSPGNLNGALLLKNFTENGFVKSDSLTPVNLTVFDSADVSITLLTLASDTISQDDTLDLAITLFNNGANNAPATIDSIVVPAFGYTLSPDYLLTANNGHIFELTPFVSNAFSGDIPFIISIYWHDHFIGGQNMLNAQDTVVVLNKANILITGIMNDTTVSLGQQGIPVGVSVTNTGQVPANIQDINFEQQIGIYTINQSGAFENIPPGETINYSFTFDVSTNSAIGPDTIAVNVSAQDSISGNPAQADSSFSWIIGSPSDVKILSALPAQSIVSRGQSNIPVKVIFENQGGEKTQIDTVFLHFSNGDNNYTGIEETPADFILGNNQQDSVEFLVSVDGNAPLGNVVINASAVGRALTSGNDINITQANVKGSWMIQRRPQITVPLLSLNKDTVSTGQDNIVLTLRVRNNGGGLPTATAIVDSMHLVIDGITNDQAHFTFPQFPDSINLVNNLQLDFNLPLMVQDTAQSGVHNFQATIYYKDINDDSTFNFPAGSGASDNLVVQQRGVLDITDIQIVPDSAYVGQNDVAFTVTTKNIGEAKVQLNSADLNLHGAGNFVKSLQTFGFPFVLRQSDSIDVEYLVDVPNTLNLPPFTDTLIYAGGRLNGIELNSGTTFLPIEEDSLSSLTVVNPAHVVFDTLVPTGLLGVDTMVSFRAFVFNDGGSNLYLNSNTRLRLVRIGDPADSTVILINTDSSDMKIFSGDSAQLVFQEQQLSQTGDFQVFLEIDGAVHLRSYKQTLTIPQEINVGGVLSVNTPLVTPSSVSPNQDSVNVSVGIVNIGPTLFIDSAQTILQFQYVGGEPLLINSTRIDTLTKIPQNPPPLPPVRLEWQFKVPVDARTGQVEVRAFLSFNGGTVLREKSGIFSIASGVEIDYVLNSLTPDSTVPGQNVAFLATFSNTGNTSLNLNPDSSYLQFDDGTRTYRALVNGNLTIRGTQDSVETSVITFKTTQVDSGFIPDIAYPVTFVMEGSLPNLEPYGGYNSTFNNQLTMLEEANVQVDSINVVPSAIHAGQNDVEVQYYLRNTGKSPGNLSAMTSVFRDSSGGNINASWIQVFQSHNLPLILDEQDTALITRKFNISPSINPTVARASVTGQFNDTRKPGPGGTKTFGNPAIYDSVNVILQSSIFIDSLVLANVPNAVEGTVNYGQAYDLRLVLQNFGEDSLRDIEVELLLNSVQIFNDTLPGPVLANDTLQKIYHLVAGSTSETRNYRARLISAKSATSGENVPLGQPNEDTQPVTIQQPSVLTLTALASDSSLSQNQEFQVVFQINRFGQSPIGEGAVRIALPENYSLASTTPDSTLPINESTLAGSWDVAAVDTTTGLEDTIIVEYASIPVDQNTNNTVFVTNTDTIIPVSTRNFGSVEVTSITIIEPPGALDNILSTGQTFRLKAQFNFIGAVSSAGREAELVLPAGAGFLSDSTIKSLNSDSAIWQIRAPDVVTQLSQKTGNQNGRSDTSTRSINDNIEVLQGELFNLQVIVRAVEENTGSPLSSTMDHQVEVQDRAELEVHANIVSPLGAIDGVVSSEQSFFVRIWVADSGEAQTMGNNAVVLKVTPGFDLPASPVDTILLAIPTGEAFAETLEVVAPDSALASQQLRVSIKNAATDENTNKPAFVSTRQQFIQLNVVNRASLTVDNLQVVSPPGATDNIVSYEQTFTFQAVVNNTGQAGVVAPPQGTVEIQLDDLLQIVGGTNPASFNIGQPVQWQVKADSNASAKILMRKIQELKTQSKNLVKPGTGAKTTGATLLKDSQISLRNQEENNALESVNDRLSNLYEQLTTLIDSSVITVNIKTTPFDENTLDSAFVEQRNKDAKIYIQEKPFINVASWQIRQTWSTDQIDTVEALISKPDHVTIESASLILPPGFNNLGMEVLGNLYRWRVRTPQNVQAQTVVSLHFVGIDQNNLIDTVTVNRDTSITVQSQAQLKLRSNVYSLRVSQNQKFTVNATVLNEGEAGIAGTGVLELLPGEMLLDQGEVPEKTFTGLPTTLNWNLVAPDTNVNTLVTIRVKQRPLDINKTLPVQLSDSDRVVIDVNMIPKRLFVHRLEKVKPTSNYVQGSQNVEILGLGLKNPETLKPDTIYVDQFSLSVTDPQNDNQPILDLNNLISRVKIVNFDDLSQFTKPGAEAPLFADIPITANTPNPIPVDFSVDLDTVTSGDLDELVVLIDIAAGAPNQNFSIGLQDISAYQMVGANKFGVEVTDSIGNPLSAITSQLKSPPVSVVSGNPEQIFGNYPNPFGLDDAGGTKFIFFMENPGTADLRIYTLLGELVWSFSMDISSRGLKDGLIGWDGRNDVGRRVLNGVYIAVLKVEYTGGQTKTFRTKVALIK